MKNLSRWISVCTLMVLVNTALLVGQQPSQPSVSNAITAPASSSTGALDPAIKPGVANPAGSETSAQPSAPAEAASGYTTTPPPPNTKLRPEPGDYVVGEQDVLNIVVWKEPDLSGPAVVRPDGKITLPLLNDVQVVGLTTRELQELLTEKLKPFVAVPQVTVSPREINSRKVYVIGQVGHEGAFGINGSTTILQLIAEVGGLRDFAKRKKIYMMRTEKGQQVRYPFNYDEVIQGKRMSQNIVLQPGDTLVVP